MRQTILIGLIAATVSMPALAGHDDGDDNYRDDNYQDRARVISVAPQFERVNTPRQDCRTEYVRESYYEAPQRSLGGAVIGGVAGGLLGSTIGRGNGRVAAAAVGAGVGAIVGDRVDNNRREYGREYGRERVASRPVESCVTVDNWSQVPAGYLVNYEYNGRQYTTVTERDPGRFIPVQVVVRPNGYVTNVSYNQYGDDDDDDRGRGYGHYKHKDKHRDKNRDRNYW